MTAKATILTQYIDELFAALESRYPWAAGLLRYANVLTDQLAEAVAAQLGHFNQLAADAVLTVLIDTATAGGHALLASVLSAIKAMVDNTGVNSLPKLKLS